MGCGGSKYAREDGNMPAHPMANDGNSQYQYANGAPMQETQAPSSTKQKAVKAGTAAGLLSMLA